MTQKPLKVQYYRDLLIATRKHFHACFLSSVTTTLSFQQLQNEFKALDNWIEFGLFVYARNLVEDPDIDPIHLKQVRAELLSLCEDFETQADLFLLDPFEEFPAGN